tara:strand:- start:649 stop:864 length:216 start_codon:yes stop_codon:yes gene_type:complete
MSTWRAATCAARTNCIAASRLATVLLRIAVGARRVAFQCWRARVDAHETLTLLAATTNAKAPVGIQPPKLT